MAFKINRNKNGKQYKKCCMPSSIHSTKRDVVWYPLRQIESSLMEHHLIPYVMHTLPQEVIKASLDDFLPDELPNGMDEELLYAHLFIPWLLFHWVPYHHFDVAQFDPEKTIAFNYIKEHSETLSEAEKDVIGAMSQTYYSFYSVLEVTFEKSLVVKDILLGTVRTLQEREGTHYLQCGDVIFSCILTRNNQSIFMGMAPFIMPMSNQTMLLDFKACVVEENDDATLTAAVLRETFEVALFACFFKIMALNVNPTL